MSVYLLRTREFKETNKPVYKIGRTDPNKPSNYPKGSELILSCKCIHSDYKIIENIIRKEFSQNFRQRKDLGGTQTFEGDLGLMRNCMLDILYRFDTDIVPMDLG